MINPTSISPIQLWYINKSDIVVFDFGHELSLSQIWHIFTSLNIRWSYSFELFSTRNCVKSIRIKNPLLALIRQNSDQVFGKIGAETYFQFKGYFKGCWMPPLTSVSNSKRLTKKKHRPTCVVPWSCFRSAPPYRLLIIVIMPFICVAYVCTRLIFFFFFFFLLFLSVQFFSLFSVNSFYLYYWLYTLMYIFLKNSVRNKGRCTHALRTIIFFLLSARPILCVLLLLA